MKSLGPREQQIRALRETKAQRRAATTPKTPPAPPVTKETTMAKSTKKPTTNERRATAARKADKAKKPRAAAKKAAGESARGAKTEMVLGMLKRPEGCTSAEVCEATGWAAVSIPPIARRAGLELKKEKVDGATRYRIAA